VRSVACVLGAAIAFGTVSVLARRAYEAGSTPVSLLGVRMLVAALLLTGLAVRGGSWRIHPGELAAGAAAGTVFAAAGLGEFEALARAPAPTVVVLVFVAPVWIAVAVWAAGQGAPGWLPASAMALILVGLALVVRVPGGHGADGAAVALALGASVMSAAFFVAMARLSGRVTPWRAACMAAWAASIATVLVEPSGLSRELSHRATACHGLAIGALTVCGLALLAAGLQANSALWASAVIGVEPLAAAALAWPILGETLSATQLAGAAGVLLGVTAIATDRTRRRPLGSRPPPRPARNAPRRQ
jgi:drug/metabolite transporter (DMT)-like permease